MEYHPNSSRTYCVRCGECCLKASPTLHLADIPLVKEGHIDKADLYTIRTGELVLDNIYNVLRKTPHEMVKLREKKEGGGCIFYDNEAKACTDYAHRPIQCVALACWDVTEFLEVHRRPKAVRKDFIADTVLQELIDRHEEKCNYKRIEAQVKRIESEGHRAIDNLIELLKFDYHLRPFISKKLDLNPHQLDFLLGRPLTETITMFGLKVVKDVDGGFLLTTLQRMHP